MPFSTSSPVRKVEIGTSFRNGVYALQWEWRETDGSWHSEAALGEPNNYEETPEQQILQQIYASDTGLRDENNAPVTVKVSTGLGSPLVTTPESLERYGLVNPLSAGSIDRWATKRRTQGVMQERGSVVEQASGAPERIELHAGLVPQPQVRTGSGRVWLGQWENTVARETGDLHDPSVTVTIFQIQLDISRLANVTPDGLDNYTPVVGLRAFLNNLRTAGIALGTDFSNFASWSNRTFNLTSSRAGSTAFSFRVDRIHHTTAAPVTGCWIECVVTAGTYDRAALAAALATYQVLTGVTTSVTTEVPFGDQLTALLGSRIELSGGAVNIYGSNGQLLFGVKDRDSDVETKVPYGSHRVVDFEALPTATYRRGVTDHTIRETPRWIDVPHAQEIHFRGTTPRTDGIYDTLRVREPIGDNRIAGIATPLHVDNQGTQRLNIIDENDVQVILLEPGESLGMRFVADLEGGRSLLTDPHTRRWTKLSQSVTGGLDGSPAAYWSFDANHWALLPQVPPSSVVHNGGAFGAGSRTFTNTSDFVAANIPAHPWAIEIAADGHLRLSQRIQIRIGSGVTGVIPSGSRTMTYRKRGTALTLIGEAVLNEPISSGISRQILAWEAEDEVEDGDIIVTVLVFAKTSNIGNGNMDVTLFSRNLELDRQINRSL